MGRELRFVLLLTCWWMVGWTDQLNEWICREEKYRKYQRASLWLTAT